MDVNPVKIPAPQPKQLPRKSRKGKAEVNRCKTVMAQGVLWEIGHWVCFTKLRQFSVESQKYCGVFPSAFFKFKLFSCLRKLSLSFNPKRGRNNPTCDLGTLVFPGFMQLTRFFSRVPMGSFWYFRSLSLAVVTTAVLVAVQSNLHYHALWLVRRIRAALSTNQMQT